MFLDIGELALIIMAEQLQAADMLWHEKKSTVALGVGRGSWAASAFVCSVGSGRGELHDIDNDA